MGAKKAPADPARFREASDWFRGRVPVTRDEWEQLTVAERRQAFVLAGTQQLEVVQTVFDEIAKAIDNGSAIDAFRKALKKKLGQRFTEQNATNLTTAFINANQMAYNTGRWYQMSTPSVTRAVPYWRFDAVLDQSTTQVCRSLTGTIRRHDDPWWLTHHPPMHHNAIDACTLIETASGSKRAGDVTPGTHVLTHMGRWKRVTAVIRKQVVARPVRVLTTLSGRTLRVTYEHPILRAGTLTWEVAGNLQVGDAVFQEGKQSSGVARASVGYPKDAPPLRHQPSIANGVTPFPGQRVMVLPVHLDANTLAWERYVDDVAVNAVLCDGPEGAQEVEQIRFLRSEFLAKDLSTGSRHAVPHVFDTGWIPGSHAPLMNGNAVIGAGAQAPCPVVFSGTCCNPRWIGVSDAHLVTPASKRYSVHFAPTPDDTVAGAELSFKRANTPPLFPVFDANKGSESLSVREVEWHEATIVSITEERYSGELLDLTVEDDESYVASGIIVHNCRSAVRALSERMVKRAGGPTREAPRPDIVGDWGLAPPLRAGAMWHPDLAKYDAHLAREYTRKQESMRARAAKKRRKTADTDITFEAKFAGGQPRVPAGSSKGGQWTSGRAGGGSYASPLHDPAHHEAELKAQYGEAASTVAWGRAMEHQGRALTPEQLHESVDALKAAGVDVYDIRTSPMHAKLLKDGHADAGSLLDAARASANDPKKNPMLAKMEGQRVASFEATVALAAHHRALGDNRAGDIRLDHDVSVAPGAKLPHGELRGARDDAANAFGALSHADLKQPTGYRWTADHEDRAFQRGTEINFGAGGTSNRHEITSAVMHEWGHAIEERNPDRLAKSVAYLQARTKGEPVVKLNTLKNHKDYGDDELTQPDKLHTPFAGKVYEGKGPGGREATELLATTTEHLNNTQRMADVVATDKDTFHFVLGQLANQ